MMSDGDVLLPNARLRARYDNVSAMTIYRWQNDPHLGFPAPTKIRNRNYWRLSEIVEWEQRLALASARSRGKSLTAGSIPDEAERDATS